MLAALLISAALVILLYSGRMLWYYVSITRYQEPVAREKVQPLVPVSVIIPVRNEEQHLPLLISDLLAQDYPARVHEVIFADDHSTDRSAILLEEVCRKHANFSFLCLPEGKTGKKEALHAGIEAASGEWIIQTDADCRLPESFISGHVGYAVAGADLLAGPVVVHPVKSVWNRMEALEHFGLTATSLGAAAGGRPVMCSGANLSYSKRFYRELSENLFAVPHASGDDVFLLAEAKKQKKKILFMFTPEMVVMTTPTAGPKAFLRQRIRWGSKARFYKDTDMVALAVLVWLTNAALTALFTASLFVSGVVWVFLPALVIKSFSEFLLLREAADRIGHKVLLGIFPTAALFYYFYITFAGVLAMTGSFTWKGRRHSS